MRSSDSSGDLSTEPALSKAAADDTTVPFSFADHSGLTPIPETQSRSQEERDHWWMQQALLQAELASAHGDVPIGCIVVSPEQVHLGAGLNRREVDSDPTAHAEIVALREAGRCIGHWRLEGATVYCTLEPCPMCAGALVNARIARLVYGAPDLKAGAIDSLFRIGRDARLNHRFAVEGGLMAAESAQLLRAFFARLRAEGQK
jgi:tRNA(adenine34) deaminase